MERPGSTGRSTTSQKKLHAQPVAHVVGDRGNGFGGIGAVDDFDQAGGDQVGDGDAFGSRVGEPGAGIGGDLDVGTTLEAAAVELARKPELTVFTNSMNVAAAFHPSRHDVNVLGGQLAGSDGSLVGEQAVAMLLGLRLDFCLIGCSGVEDGGAVMDFDLRKIAIKRAAMQAARTRCLLATPTKFGRSARALVAPLDGFDHVLRGEGREAV